MDTIPDSQPPAPAPTPAPTVPTTPLPPKKHHLLLKIILWIIFLPIGLVLLAWLALQIGTFVFPDSAPVSDANLLLPAIPLPTQDQNAFYDLQDIANDVSIISSATSSQAEKNDATLLVLNSFRDAAFKPVYQDPVYADPSTVTPYSPLAPINPTREAVTINDSAALALAYIGESTSSLEDAYEGVDIGEKMQVSQGGIFDWLVGIALKNSALETMQTIATSTPVSSVVLTSAAAALSSTTDDSAGLVKALKIQYMSVDKYGIASTSEASHYRADFYWHPNQTLGYAIAEANKNIQIAEEPCTNFNSADGAIQQLAPSNLFFWFFTPNAIGKTLFSVTDASLNTLKQKQCDENTLVGGTKLVLALTAYQQDHRMLPATLNALVPAYLATMPIDPYSGQPFKYNSMQSMVYSVGPNHKDLNGSLGLPWETAPNPTFVASIPPQNP